MYGIEQRDKGETMWYGFAPLYHTAQDAKNTISAWTAYHDKFDFRVCVAPGVPYREAVPVPPESPKAVDEPTKQSWYQTLKPEPIEVMEAWKHLPLYRQFALKYLARAGLKGDKADHIRDLKKCISYLRRELAGLETGTPSWS